MSGNSSATDITQYLPASLTLPPHLSAHKYFFVCTLTVAAWDTLVLSPRTWRLFRTPEWPLLKVIYHLIRILMPAEFIVVAVAFFDTDWTSTMCSKFYLFEPICTAILLTAAATAHAVRIYAIYEKNTMLLGVLGAGIVAMVGAMATGAAFYHPMPFEAGQGCLAGPKHAWVGIYWLVPTIFFVATFALALIRSLQSLQVKPLGWWKLMLRDGLNLYGAIAIVHLVNVIFWFASRPTDVADSIRSIVTSMAAVLTVTMTLRIILSVRGSLASGGAYAGISTTGSGSRAGTTHVISTGQGRAAHNPSQSVRVPAADFSLDARGKPEHEWDNSSSREDTKDQLPIGPAGVKVHIERETVATDSPYTYGGGYKS